MAVVACPSAKTLTAFARGELDGAELSGVADHVEQCAACGRALRAIPNGTLAGLAREAAAAPATLPSGVTLPPGGAFPVPASTGIPAALQNHPRYRVLNELGRGGMGTVYKAEDTWMARTVALKVVSPHLTVRATALSRFRKEVQAAAQLAHNNIVRAYDTGEAGGAQFLVMEYVEGLSLDKLVAKKGRLSVQLACTLVRQAAMGLQHAADKGMVHRDIKPHNLMLTKKGQVKILDFGLARFARGGPPDDEPAPKVPFGAAKMAKGRSTVATAGTTSPNSVVGTPDYLSPEQYHNSAGVDSRSDIYSLGCTLYYLLVGKPPFAAITPLMEKLEAHARVEPPSIRLERLEVTGELADVIGRMMAKKPGDRYQTAEAVADALLPFTRAEAKGSGFEVVVEPAPLPTPAPAPAPRPKPVVAETVAEAEGRTVTEPVRPRKKKKRSWWDRNKGRTIGAAVTCAALIAVAAFGLKAWHAGWLSAPPAPQTAAKPAAPPKADAPDKPAAPPTAVVPPKSARVKVLYVLPTSGLWRSDYEPVRAQLEKRQATVVTAALDGGTTRPDTGPEVPIDVHLTQRLDTNEYDAVVFAGASVDEFVGVGRGADDAKWLIQKMLAADKTVAAIGVGVAVPAHHGVLKGKRASPCAKLVQKYPYLNAQKSGIRWDIQPGVASDGKLVTAAGERASEGAEFADAILRAVEGK